MVEMHGAEQATGQRSVRVRVTGERPGDQPGGQIQEAGDLCMRNLAGGLEAMAVPSHICDAGGKGG